MCANMVEPRKRASLRLPVLAATLISAAVLTAFSYARSKQNLAKDLSAIGYDVPGAVDPLRQPTGNVCWATAATIMYSWRNNANFDIATVMDSVGGGYRAKFDADDGLSGADKPDFLRRMVLRSEVPQSYTIAGWEALLRRYGPLWVTTAEGAGFSIHARVLIGIRGDGSAAGTSFRIVDPGDGAIHSESVQVFINKFEAVARQDLGAAGDLRPQIVHY